MIYLWNLLKSMMGISSNEDGVDNGTGEKPNDTGVGDGV